MRLENRTGRSLKLRISERLDGKNFGVVEVVDAGAAAIRDVNLMTVGGSLDSELFVRVETLAGKFAIDDGGGGAGVPEDDGNGDGGSEGIFKIYNRTDTAIPFKVLDDKGTVTRDGVIPAGPPSRLDVGYVRRVEVRLAVTADQTLTLSVKKVLVRG